MEQRKIDLAIESIPQLENGFYQQKLFRQNYVVICSSNHHRLQSDIISDEQYREELHINIKATGGHHVVENK